MPITSVQHRAFTLIELIIVIAIMGIVATLVTSRLSGMAQESAVLSPATLKSYLKSFDSAKRLDLLCYEGCTKCDLWEGGKPIRTGLRLQSDAPIEVRRFNRYGHLVSADPAVRSDGEGMREGCFAFTLHPNGVSTPLILESDQRILVYTPLSDSPQSGSEEHVRALLYPTTLMSAGGYYGSR